MNDPAGADRERDILLTPDPAPEAFLNCVAGADFSNEVPLTLVDSPSGCRHHFASWQPASESTSQQANGAMASVVPTLTRGVEDIVGAVPTAHSASHIPSAPATPPSLSQDSCMVAESPLTRRKIRASTDIPDSSFSVSSVPDRRDLSFKEAVELESICNSMRGHATGIAMMVTRQDSVFASQWNSRPNGKLEFHGWGLAPNHCWIRVSAYDVLCSCTFGFWNYLLLCLPSLFGKNMMVHYVSRLHQAVACDLLRLVLYGRTCPHQSSVRIWQN